MSKIVCPYCFETFDQSDVLFRCSNILGCKKENDPVLAKHWNAPIREEYTCFKPKFSFSSLVGSVPKSATCPKCKHETVSIVCPHCHNQLPRRFVEHKGYIISIVGARSSGKTNYIATLINQLQNNAIHLNKMGVTLSTIAPTSAKEKDRNGNESEINSYRRYTEDFFDPVYMKKICPIQTDPEEQKSKYPIIVELTHKNKAPIHLVFYDTAGENFNIPSNIAAKVEYMLSSDAFIFLLDTSEIPFVRQRLNKGETKEPFNSIVASVKDFFSSYSDSKTFFKKPIAFTFNKIDLILKNGELFRDSSIPGMAWESNSSFLDGSGVNISEIDSISDGIKSALAYSWGESNFITSMENSYQNLKYFGVSGLGEDPPASKVIANLRPYRVLDPLVWILHEFKYPLPIIK